jgi:hypothetical protein
LKAKNLLSRLLKRCKLQEAKELLKEEKRLRLRMRKVKVKQF